MSLYLGNNLISGVATPVQGARNIGQIIQSTIPLTDAGLHLLDGSLISGSGAYADFVDYIGDIYDASSNYFCSEADWQTSVTNYGVCGKFVYDSVNNTVRLPKITGFVEGTTDVTALGDLLQAGLPNITGSMQLLGDGNTGFWGEQDSNSAIYSSGSTNASIPSGGVNTTKKYISFDASRSSSIYGNSNTVQPQSIKVLYYIVIATSTQTQVEVDINEVMTDLNGKVDKADLAEVQVVVETYQSGASWYRLYSDGWCEQGGQVSTGANSTSTINLIKQFNSTNYSVTATNLSFWDSGAWSVTPVCLKDSSSSFRIGNVADTTVDFCWRACGYTS